MKYLRKFDSVSDMETAIVNNGVNFVGMAKPSGGVVTMYVPTLPTNPIINCINNVVTITSLNATTIQYRTNPSDVWTTYTEPFAITETVTVYAKAINNLGETTTSRECVYLNNLTPFYIENTTNESGTITITKNANIAPTLTVEKSTDGTTWETVGTTSTTDITTAIPAKSKLYLRSTGNKWGTATNYNRITCNKTHKIGGNINSLLYGNLFDGQTEFPSVIGSSYAFYSLFRGNTNLTNASGLMLPAMTLAEGCYKQMFYGCTALTKAPELPATTLGNYCYENMFFQCSVLVTPPTTLQATTLAEGCYTGMFNYCSSLIATPQLPATTLVNSCYYAMFAGCTALTKAPTLPAATLVNNCYYAMFNGCSRLEYIKCLATDISANGCTTNWVNGVAISGTFIKDSTMNDWTTGNNGIPTNWTVLNDTGIPTDLNISCVNNMVTISATNADVIEYRTTPSGSWTTYIVPFEINSTVTVYAKVTNTHGEITGSQQCVYHNYTTPFYIENTTNESGTVSIKKSYKTAPTVTVEKSTDGTNWSSMGSTSTMAITATVPANGKLYLRSSATTWSTDPHNYINCDKAHKVGGNINSLLYGSSFNGQTEFPVNTGTYTFNYLLKNDANLTDASELMLQSSTLTTYCYQHMFEGCRALTSAPVILPATTLAQYCYSNMFKSCSALTTAPVLPATTLANYCYQSMFESCTSLTTAPELPATIMYANCYQSMFQSCIALTTAPALPATTLAFQCYSDMFSNCTSLTTAPALSNTTLVNACYYRMFRNCSALTTAPVLPATTLAQSCYYQMFYDCTNLNYVKCLATNISANGCLDYWLNGVAATGTFVKDPNMSSWTEGASGIPSDWTVEDNS